jgi:hypothetical protein
MHICPVVANTTRYRFDDEAMMDDDAVESND